MSGAFLLCGCAGTVQDLLVTVLCGLEEPLVTVINVVTFFAGRYLSETASLNCANVLAAFVNMLRDWFTEFGA